MTDETPRIIEPEALAAARGRLEAEVTQSRCNPAAKNLEDHQRQLDVDGVEVGVSRQAVDETLAQLTRLEDAAAVVARLLLSSTARDRRVGELEQEIELTMMEIDNLRTDLDKRAGQLAVMAEALRPFAAVPKHGKHGGPFVIASASYEDMRKGDAAPRAAYLHWDAFEAAARAIQSMEGER